jgi:2-keto-4-pentenoate hydratase/2-oxohepta-3-ene-1,7-dioic acid hydratase in catechol pathway
MIFNVKKIINFISQGTTLLPGDVIMTGTPQGTTRPFMADNRRWNGKEATVMAQGWRRCGGGVRECWKMRQ